MVSKKKPSAIVGYFRQTILRWILVISVLAIYISAMMNEVKVYCDATGARAHPWFFALIMSNPVPQACFLLGAIVLLCDINEQANRLTQGISLNFWNRTRSIIMIVFTAGLAYVMIIYGVTIITLLPYLSFGGTWGTAIATLGKTTVQQEYLYVWNIPPSILFYYNPLDANIISAVLSLLLVTFIGFNIVWINRIQKSGLVAVSLIIAMILFDFHCINELSSSWLFLSPASLSRIYNLSRSASNTIPSVLYAIILFCVLNIVSLVLVTSIDILQHRSNISVCE